MGICGPRKTWAWGVALALVIEAGGSGTRAAAPVARQILDAWILREATP